ncbi:MAG: SCO family protein [Gammaproteobacteria bacterium]|nr:SCO family protein [Gammaproteobacteria bacterium]MDH3971203.1 SCO family protein [Gammaproteobacteria bacterium]MDH3985680.1 SCO family protein [Gammaproteobacteria bacterium]
MRILRLLFFCIAAIPISAYGETPAANTVPLAPGYGDLGYTAPAAGSYNLPPLRNAADGAVLDEDGNSVRLHQFYGDKMVLLSFIYSSCNDINGCPLATAVLSRIKKHLDSDPQLADNLRLLSLSFDPAHDTPEVMKLYGRSFASGKSEWQFLTTESEQALAPILDDYSQSVITEYNEKGEVTGTISHILRVYLIDRERRVRNIYSVSFLHPDLLMNDVRTLLMESQGTLPAAEAAVAATSSAPALPGDYKKGYESGEYQTQSVSLDSRNGTQADLMQVLSTPPLGLPPVPVPANNPVTKEKVALGRKLFYDRRLSLNNTFSCAMCHIPEQGFTSNELARAVGIEGRTVRRNAPTVYNSAYLTRLFHDGREHNLEQQVWGPLLAKNEMGNPSFALVIDRIRNIADYQGLFEAAFDGKGPGMETIGQALASYERTLVSANSPFDRWYYGKDNEAMDRSAQRGFGLFQGKAKCTSCHTVTDKHALFTDNAMHNTGIGWHSAMQATPAKRRVQVAPGVYHDVDAKIISAVSERPPGDVGLYEVTQNPADRWKYRTSTLRNVALTAPYMHDGSMETLKDVVEFYNQGGLANENLDPLLVPLHLSPQEIDDLVAFMNALTGDNVDILVSDAFAAPVGDLRKQDPDWTHDNKGNF